MAHELQLLPKITRWFSRLFRACLKQETKTVQKPVIENRDFLILHVLAEKVAIRFEVAMMLRGRDGSSVWEFNELRSWLPKIDPNDPDSWMAIGLAAIRLHEIVTILSNIGRLHWSELISQEENAWLESLIVAYRLRTLTILEESD